MALLVDIEKRFGDFLLKSRFEAENEVLALLGASGCGKSVTLKCIAGVELPDRGRIVLDGRVLFDTDQRIHVPARERHIGYLFQNYALFPKMTVEENIACGIRGTKKEKQRQVGGLMERFYLKELGKQYPHQLSGGQQQRTALARMLAARPTLIMLDEPFSALDDYLKWKMEQEIMATLADFQGTALFVSHNRDEVYRLSDRIAVMDAGRIEVLEAKKKVFQDPRTLSATLLTGCKNISRAEKRNDHLLFAADWGICIRSAEKVMDDLKYVGFRSHYFQMVDHMEEVNVLKCDQIKVIEDTFSYIVLFHHAGCKEIGDYTQLRYELTKEQWLRRDPKRPLYLRIPEDQLILMR